MIGAPKLEKTKLRFRGIGSNNNSTLGNFSTDIYIDGEIYPIVIHVVPDDLMQHDLLIGTDFLNTVEICIKEGKISISKPKENTRIVSDMFRIDNTLEANGIDLSYVESRDRREKLQHMIDTYQPNKICELDVKMNIILKDDVPVFQRPRRLSPSERQEVDSQMKEWLEEGVIQASQSEYASPIVLVKKKGWFD